MNRFNILFLIIFFTFILPGPQTAPITSDEQYNKLSLFKNHLYQSYHLLRNSTFQHSFGNLTGFHLSYQDALDGVENQTYPLPGKDYDHWENNQSYSILPDGITNEALSIWTLESPASEDLNYYTNISSQSRGKYHIINSTNFTQIPLQLPHYLESFNEDLSIPSSDQNSNFNSPSKLIGNITDTNGSVVMDITVVDTLNKKYFNPIDDDVKLINLDLQISDEDEYHQHSIETKGFYFVRSGNILTASSSAKFFSFYGGLQHLSFNEKNFDSAKNLSLSYLDETFFKASESDNLDINFNYLTQWLERAETHCEYVTYFHLNKVNLTKEEIKDIDEELESPIGRPIDFNRVPNINLTGLIYSPDCAIQISIPQAIGVKREIRLLNYQKVVIGGILILLVQIILTMKQMNYTNTPSTISRISFWSICLMSLVDGSLSMIYLVSSAVLNQLYLPLTVSAFLSFILASLFEMRFMINIYVSQTNERSLNIFTALQGRAIDDENNMPDGEAQQQLPTTGGNNVAPPATAEPQEVSQVSGTIYSRFFFALIIFTFVMMNSVMWPKHLRQKFEYVTLFILNSYWLPQVYRNVIRGSHRSFKWWFIFGTTIVRTIPIFYIFVIESNIFQHHRDENYFMIISAWLGFQIFLLFLQNTLGARFFLPKQWLPQTYDYHPALTETDLENGFGIDHVHGGSDEGDEEALIGGSGTGEDSSRDPTMTIKHDTSGRCTIDCAICMNEVEVPVMKSHLDQASTFLQRRSYMVTPCRHIFHTQCLEAWMKYKLQCPVCRNSLPPL